MIADTLDATLGEQRLQRETTYRIGRSSDCEIVLAEGSVVSRRHAELRFDGTAWNLRDLDSTNGTFVNDRRIDAAVALKNGDRITIGRDGPTLPFALVLASPKAVAVQAAQPPKTPLPGGQPKRAASSLSLSELLPFLSKDRAFVWKNPYLLPGMVTLAVCIALLTLSGLQSDALNTAGTGLLAAPLRIAALKASIGYAIDFNNILGVYLCAALYFGIVKLTGRHKPIWFAVAVAFTTWLVLESPIWELLAYVFKDVLPGEVDLAAPFSIGKFIHTFIGIGLLEELVKQLPVIALIALAPKLSAKLRATIGINDPLDGIVVATASVAGFIVFETLGQYVGGQFGDLLASFDKAGFDPAATFVNAAVIESAALQTLVFRILSETVGHVAYSGYFGYALGLAVLHRRHFWRIAAVGWVVAATLHAVWDSMIVLGQPVQFAIGVAALVVLLAAIRRARRDLGLSVPLQRAATS